MIRLSSLIALLPLMGLLPDFRSSNEEKVEQQIFIDFGFYKKVKRSLEINTNTNPTKQPLNEEGLFKEIHKIGNSKKLPFFLGNITGESIKIRLVGFLNKELRRETYKIGPGKLSLWIKEFDLSASKNQYIKLGDNKTITGEIAIDVLVDGEETQNKIESVFSPEKRAEMNEIEKKKKGWTTIGIVMAIAGGLGLLVTVSGAIYYFVLPEEGLSYSSLLKEEEEEDEEEEEEEEEDDEEEF